MIDILALSNLLDAAAQHDISNRNTQSSGSASRSATITPASFGPPRSSVAERSVRTSRRSHSKEIPEQASIVEDLNDNRPEPEYQIYFKQDIGTEDIFLGTEKSQGSFDCSHIVVKIHFPGCSMSDLNLKVEPNRLLAESAEK